MLEEDSNGYAGNLVRGCSAILERPAQKNKFALTKAQLCGKWNWPDVRSTADFLIEFYKLITENATAAVREPAMVQFLKKGFDSSSFPRRKQVFAVSEVGTPLRRTAPTQNTCRFAYLSRPFN